MHVWNSEHAAGRHSSQLPQLCLCLRSMQRGQAAELLLHAVASGCCCRAIQAGSRSCITAQASMPAVLGALKGWTALTS